MRLPLAVLAAHARDVGQWGNQDAKISEWYRSLMQPDAPYMSCCGAADGYWADSFAVEGDHFVAVITDEREDAPLGRVHRELGTKFVVPNHKMKIDAGNPTGHFVIFINAGGVVLCYVTGPLT